jgi:hypothetical protein
MATGAIAWSVKHFLSQTHIYWIFFIQFYCADHIPSAVGDALNNSPTYEHCYIEVGE